MSKEKSTQKFVRKAPITVPTLSLKEVKVGQSLFVKILDTIRTKIDVDKNGEPRIENGNPVELHIVRVENLEHSGSVCDMVLPFKVNEAFTVELNGDYVGRSFELVKGPKVNRMNLWEVWELE